MLMQTSRERWDLVVKESEERLNLAEAALLIAAEEYPDLDVDRYLGRLDELMRQIARNAGKSGQ